MKRHSILTVLAVVVAGSSALGQKISDLPTRDAALAAGDLMVFNDIDSPETATGRTEKVPISDLRDWFFSNATAIDLSGATIAANGSDPNNGVTITPEGAGNITIGTMTFDSDQTIGAGQDNYVLTYDNGTGLVGLESAAAGSFDATAQDALTWSDGANASNIWTFDVSGTDTTFTAGNGTVGFSHDVTVGGDLTVTGDQTVANVNATSLVFEGATADDFETTIAVVDPTADRTFTLPDASGTAATLAGTETLSNKTLVAPALGTPASGVATNLTGTATGLITGGSRMAVNSKAAGYTVGTDSSRELDGGFIVVTAAATIQGPTTLVAGMNWTIKGNVAGAVVFNPDDAHTITLDGTALAAGDSVTSTSTLGDLIVCVATSTTTIDVTSNGWTDTN